MSRIKLVASDLDGTLLTKEAKLCEADSLAITEMTGRGIFFLPITGRALSEVPDFIKTHPAVKYVISSNGGNITNVKEGGTVSCEMSPELSAKVYRVLKKYPLFTSPHIGGVGYVNPDELKEEILAGYGISPYYIKFFDGLSVPMPDLDKRLSEGLATEMFASFSGDGEALDACLEELSHIEGIGTTRSTSGEIEVISESSGKGRGLLRFAAMQGIDPSEIIVAGDSMNDVSMFRVAGLSVAAPSAIDAVRAEATYAMTESDGGVAEYILKKFIW